MKNATIQLKVYKVKGLFLTLHTEQWLKKENILEDRKRLQSVNIENSKQRNLNIENLEQDKRKIKGYEIEASVCDRTVSNQLNGVEFTDRNVWRAWYPHEHHIVQSTVTNQLIEIAQNVPVGEYSLIFFLLFFHCLKIAICRVELLVTIARKLCITYIFNCLFFCISYSHALPRRKIHQPLFCKEGKTLFKDSPRYDNKTVWWWGSSNAGALGNAEYLFIGLVLWYNQAWCGSTW